jgi:hypothetical protein
MNIVRTVILKFMLTPDTPGVLRGELQLVPETGEYTFRGDEDLLALLHQIASLNQQVSSLEKPESDHSNLE